MRPQLYYSGESLNIGLKWTDHATTTEVNSKAQDLQDQIDALKVRTKAVEDDLNGRTFG